MSSTMENTTAWPQFEVIFLTSVDEYFAVLQTVLCILILPISLTLIFGICHYEHFGVDSQKRSFFNQAISAVFVCLGFNQIFVLIPMTARCWTGPFGHAGGIVVTFTRRLLLIMILMWIVEFLVYQNIKHLKPNYIIRFRDDFWARFCWAWNILFGILLTNTYWFYPEGNHPSIYLFMSGKDEITMSQQHTYVFSFYSFCIFHF